MNQLLAGINVLLALVMGRSASAKVPRRLTGSPSAGRSEHPAPSASIITAARRRMLLIALLLASVTLLLTPGTSDAQTPANQAATGRPVVLVSAEGAGILAADTWRIADGNGLPYTDYKDTVMPVGSGGVDNGKFVFNFSYQWIRVDGGTDTNIGTDSPRYQLVDADFGKRIKVRVSFTDDDSFSESVTSVPFGPIARPAPLPAPSTLVGNTGQSPTVTKMITGDYAMRFKLGTHGQGYEISSVSIELAAAPSSLSVSLWTGGPPGSAGHSLEIAVYRTTLPRNATGRPVVLASAEDPGVLAVDTSSIADPDGIPNVGSLESTGVLHDFSYRWIRVDGDTETVVGADSADYRQIDAPLEAAGIFIELGRYRRVEADIGKLLKVEVSFTDVQGTPETVTSLPFGPVLRPAAAPPVSTLVANTGQTPSTTATITTDRYDMGFKLGSHGQGYEISDVSIELAAAPSSLTVSLWMGRAPGSGIAGAQTKLFDFENPSSFKVGLNRFSAPPGAFAYQNVGYFIVLSDFGSSLSIKETTSDAEDSGGETGATLANEASSSGSGVLRMAVEGSKRASGILASTYAQVADAQEIVSIGDEIGFGITVGAADRYLIRGASFSGDNSATGGLFTTPWDLRDGTTTLFRMFSTRQISGINEFTAPQGATVPGGCTTDTMTMVETCETYNFYKNIPDPREGGVVLSRYFGTSSDAEDKPKATGVTIDDETGDFSLNAPFMAIFGEPLVAMVQNLGQTDNTYVSLGHPGFQVLSQGFTTDPSRVRVPAAGRRRRH